MGTIIYTSDGADVRLGGEPEGIIKNIASALDTDRETVDEQGKSLPKGFAVFTEPQGNQVWVNTAQITRIKKS
jgi:hypothetical protein